MWQTGAPVQDLTKLLAQLFSLAVDCRAGGVVRDQRGGEDVLGAEGERGGVGGDGADASHGVALEHEDGAIEGGGAADGVGEERVRARLGGDVVFLEVDGEAGVGEADVLAGGRVEGDAGPGGKILVGAGLGLGGQRADVVERLGVD